MRPEKLMLAMVLSGIGSVHGDNWPQFRGPNGAGHANAEGLPIRWGETDNVRWKTPIHDRGWSSPVVWDNQIWLTTAHADGKEMFALAVDGETGKIVHDLKLLDVPEPAFCHPFNSYASPTPVIEAGRVYVHFGSYGTACLETSTGKVVWLRRDLPCEHFRGPGSSPILHDDLLIVPFDGFDTQYVIALDKHTGKTVWKKDRDIDYETDDGDRKKGYGTAAVVTVNGKPLLVSPSAMATIAYQPDSGAEVWRVRHGGMNVAAPPLFVHDLFILTTGDGGLKLLAVKPNGTGDITDSHIAWKFAKGVPSHTAPLAIGNLLYLFNEQGVATCLEAKTGAQVWQKRMSGKFRAAPVFADGRIYAFDDEHGGHVLEPGRTPKVLAVNKLADGCMATPAIAGKALLVRTKTHLYRLEQR